MGADFQAFWAKQLLLSESLLRVAVPHCPNRPGPHGEGIVPNMASSGIVGCFDKLNQGEWHRHEAGLHFK